MTEPSLPAMLEARSVAVIGASSRPGSFGEQMMIQLTRGGFQGTIYPVNPSYREVLGYRCYGSPAEVPERVDLALLGVRNAQLEETLREAARAGARSAAIFASCWEAPVPGRPSLSERLAAIAGEGGMAVCGGNCMGFINVERGLRACGFHEPEDMEHGSITFISHSGSVFSAMLHNDRGLRFNLVVSPGTELVTTAADYMHYALDQSSTKVIGIFLETVRDPEGFRSALGRAFHQDVPVVTLKVGREPQARELVAAHSGAIAGEDGAFEALFDAYGVLRVRTLDEMADTIELFAAGRRAPRGGLAGIHDSGGERAHLIDSASDAGVLFAVISEKTRARLASALEEGLPPVNPLDAWGTGNRADQIFIECMTALLEDPDTAALAFGVDLTTEPAPEAGYTRVAEEVFARTDKPVAVLGNMTCAIDRPDAGLLRRQGIPVLQGTATGLAALRHLLEYRDSRELPPVGRGPLPPSEVSDRWRARLDSPLPLSEIEGLTLLADFGLIVTAAEVARSADSAEEAAERIGWPVALKTAAAGVLHKIEVDGVKLGLRDGRAVRDAFDDLKARLGPEVIVAKMAPPGVEIALGVVGDAQFGPLVMVAAGGALVEVLEDRQFGLPPVDESRARRMLDRLAIRRLLDGVRGSPPANVDGVVDAIVRLSVLAEELGDAVEALDVNPLIAGMERCVAVDALVIPKTHA